MKTCSPASRKPAAVEKSAALLQRLIVWIALACLLLSTACGAVQATQDQPPPPANPPSQQNEPLPGGPPPANLAALAQFSRWPRFEHITPESGISQSVVLDIVQDDLGFLWMATQDGLNRFDGRTFKVFKDDPSAPSSLRGNFISAIDKAPDGKLWIGTNDGGLTSYDPQTGLFTAYLHNPASGNSISENSISALVVDPNGIVWVGTNNQGLNRLDPASGRVTRYANDPQDPASLSQGAITALAVAANGEIWAASNTSGLNRLDPASAKITHYTASDSADTGGIDTGGSDTSLSQNAIQSLFIDRQGMVWVGTFLAGLNRLDPSTGKVTRYLHDDDNPASLGFDSVTTIFEDSLGRLWVGTQNAGLNLLDRQTGQFTRYQHDPNDPDSLGSDNISTIFEDSSGILWVGLFGAGVDNFDPYRNKFMLLQSRPGETQGLAANSLWSIIEDDQGRLWFATNGAGLSVFDPATRTWKTYTHDSADPNSLSDDFVFSSYKDRQGDLWFGALSGLNRFDPLSETFTLYPMPLPLSMLEDTRGNFWVGTASVGLVLFDRQEGALHSIDGDSLAPDSLSSDSITVLYQDMQDNLWIGTNNGGMNRYDYASNSFVHYGKDPSQPNSISSNTILSILQARDGLLWVGTTGGLNRFDPASGVFTAFREKDGLPNDFVYTLLEDDAGSLWIGTNKGLAAFDPATEIFRDYDRSDGLQSNEFNQFSAYKDSQGVLYFGGVNGLNAFYPSQIQDNLFAPQVVLTQFDIYNQVVPVGPDSPLKQPVEVTPALALEYTDDFFEFEYASLHYSSPGEIQYAYLMENLDKNWNYVGNRRFASYTNVPPGEYTFRVRATNSDGRWSEHEAVLKISIPPPFWQTLWFRLLVILGSLGAISGVFVLRIRAIEAQRQELELKVDERTLQLRQAMIEAEAANRAKSTFLANMSHEFRTPLNAILGFTQIMTRDERLGPDQQENIAIIHRSSEHLLGLINDVLEMSKIEAGRAVLNKTNFDLSRMLEGLEEMFSVRAGSKGVALRLELAAQTPQYVHADEGKLRQVLMNLLGNAVKFTKAGLITLRAFPVQEGREAPPGEQFICFEVEDTGPGIAPEEIEQLFLPFVQSSAGLESQEGTGLGLTISQQFVRLMGAPPAVVSEPAGIRVRSQVGQGSIFSFTVPVGLVPEDDIQEPGPARKIIGLEPGQPVYRLLAVDDQEVNRKLLVRILAPLGFELREAANGQEAIETWETWEPHLIWMDMRMPVMDGYQATRYIKSTIRGQATIIVAITASSLEEDRHVILAEGCDDYMRKPFLEATLFKMLEQHLGVRFIYQPLEPSPQTGQPPGAAGPPEAPSSRQRRLAIHLSQADPQWLNQLERATILADQDELLNLAAQIAGSDPALSRDITTLVNKFDHDRILFLIQQARELANHEPK